MKKHRFTSLYFLIALCQFTHAAEKPNILLILADDLGYGDVGCYNGQSKVATPHLDRLAREGMRFTDAHSPATVCTPTRYSLMTGQMAFQTMANRFASRKPNAAAAMLKTKIKIVAVKTLVADMENRLRTLLNANSLATISVALFHA